MFSEKITAYVNNLLVRYPILESAGADIRRAYEVMENSFACKGKLLVCGNGGSAADAEHIVGELMKGFCLPRNLDRAMMNALKKTDSEFGGKLAEKLQRALPAIALSNHNSLNTAFLNDVDGLLCYAQQVMGYGNPGDIFMGISTSGNSGNILYAAVTARAKGLKVIGLAGQNGGKLREYADVCIRVNETDTYKVQELQLPVYHCLCLMLEERFFGEAGKER